ncbi:hypothetical protein [Flavobacterium ginsengiterrae]|uniref:Uncharacterized protein n=1 Tax=Flavobacterium ginsengiterrae TaxID=871695 RepID=A0ABP7G610_9FLAO
MTLSYFLTGSCNDQDTDFELIISIVEEISSTRYLARLEDLSTADRLATETSRPLFENCLKDIAIFMENNNIRFYGKSRTSASNDPDIDKKLADFIYRRIPEHM